MKTNFFIFGYHWLMKLVHALLFSATLTMVTVHIYGDEATDQHEMTRTHLNSYLDISLHVN